VPVKIWASGFFLSSIMCVIIVTLWFDMRLWEAIVAILFGIPLAVICIQCSGETDTTPLGAVGKVHSPNCRMFPRCIVEWRLWL
jgi:hypothetical protein